jgi:hypothetical protein
MSAPRISRPGNSCGVDVGRLIPPLIGGMTVMTAMIAMTQVGCSAVWLASSENSRGDTVLDQSHSLSGSQAAAHDLDDFGPTSEASQGAQPLCRALVSYVIMADVRNWSGIEVRRGSQPEARSRSGMLP